MAGSQRPIASFSSLLFPPLISVMGPNSPPRKIKDLCNPIIENPIHKTHQSTWHQSRTTTECKYGHSIKDLLNHNDATVESTQFNSAPNFIDRYIIESGNLSKHDQMSTLSNQLPCSHYLAPELGRNTPVKNQNVGTVPQRFDQSNNTCRIENLKLDFASTTVQTKNNHNTQKRHPCERCGRIFSRKADAAKHISVVHDRIKNFICINCGRRFGRKDYLVVSGYFNIIVTSM